MGQQRAIVAPLVEQQQSCCPRRGAIAPLRGQRTEGESFALRCRLLPRRGQLPLWFAPRRGQQQSCCSPPGMNRGQSNVKDGARALPSGQQKRTGDGTPPSVRFAVPPLGVKDGATKGKNVVVLSSRSEALRATACLFPPLPLRGKATEFYWL